MATPRHERISLLLHNWNCAAVINHNIIIFYAGCLICNPGTHRLRTAVLQQWQLQDVELSVIHQSLLSVVSGTYKEHPGSHGVREEDSVAPGLSDILTETLVCLPPKRPQCHMPGEPASIQMGVDREESFTRKQVTGWGMLSVSHFISHKV